MENPSVIGNVRRGYHAVQYIGDGGTAYYAERDVSGLMTAADVYGIGCPHDRDMRFQTKLKHVNFIGNLYRANIDCSYCTALTSMHIQNGYRVGLGDMIGCSNFIGVIDNLGNWFPLWYNLYCDYGENYSRRFSGCKSLTGSISDVKAQLDRKCTAALPGPGGSDVKTSYTYTRMFAGCTSMSDYSTYYNSTYPDVYSWVR